MTGKPKTSIIDHTTTCPYCGHRVLPANLKTHLQNQHAREYLDEKFSEKLDGRKRQVRCPHCQQVLFFSFLEEHISKVHPEFKKEPGQTTPTSLSSPPNEELQYCALCRIQVKAANLEKHLRKFHPDVQIDQLKLDEYRALAIQITPGINGFPCPVCKVVLKSRLKMETHLHKVHPLFEKTTPEAQPARMLNQPVKTKVVAKHTPGEQKNLALNSVQNKPSVKPKKKPAKVIHRFVYCKFCQGTVEASSLEEHLSSFDHSTRSDSRKPAGPANPQAVRPAAGQKNVSLKPGKTPPSQGKVQPGKKPAASQKKPAQAKRDPRIDPRFPGAGKYDLEAYKQSFDEPIDGSKGLGNLEREWDGKYGSYPLHDPYDEESDSE